MPNVVQLQINTGGPLTVHVFHKVEVVDEQEYFVGYEVEAIAGLPKPRYRLDTRTDVEDYLREAGVPVKEIICDTTEQELGL
jgi:hypothetical protein